MRGIAVAMIVLSYVLTLVAMQNRNNKLAQFLTRAMQNTERLNEAETSIIFHSGSWVTGSESDVSTATGGCFSSGAILLVPSNSPLERTEDRV